MSDSEVLKPRSITELREAKEARTADVLLLKDEQIEIITRQNQTLLESINKAEEESSALQLEKLAIEDENRDLRKSNFESQTRACAAESQFQALKEESLSRDKQLQILTEQNGELLRLLEIEETQNAQISSKYELCKEERDNLDAQFKVLTIKNKSCEDVANLASREGCLRSEEVKLLQSDREKLIKENANITMQTSLEVDSLRDQARLAKEKQYKLLHKIQNLEEVKERAQDEVVTLKERIKVLDRMSIDVDSKLQTEIRNNSNHEEVQRKLTDELKRCQKINKDLTFKIQHAEQDRLETEAEARDSADQLREMAEKVFQLLERLKLAELGKTRSVEAMRSKEQESIALKKKIALLTKEVEREGKARSKIGFDAREHQVKMRALKKHNIQLGLRCKEETKMRLKEEQERNLANDKIHTLDSRIVFLAEKLKSNEDALKCSRIEIKKMEDQLSSWANQNQILHERIFSLEKKNESLMTDLDLKEKEVKSCKIDFESLQRHANSLKEEHQRTTKQKSNEILDDNIADNIDEQMDEGRLRFYADNSLNNGLIVIKGKRAKDKEWLESRKCNHILKRSLKSVNVKGTLVQRLAEIYGMYMTKEEEVVRIQNKLEAKDDLICSLQTKNFTLQKRLSQEEESKRKTLLNYIGSMKDQTNTSESKESLGNSNFNNNRLCRIKLQEVRFLDTTFIFATILIFQFFDLIELHLRRRDAFDSSSSPRHRQHSGIEFEGKFTYRRGGSINCVPFPIIAFSYIYRFTKK